MWTAGLLVRLLQVMVAHTAFTEATDLLLKSHAWLVKAGAGFLDCV